MKADCRRTNYREQATWNFYIFVNLHFYLQSQFYSKMMPSVFQSLQDMDEQRVKMIQVTFSEIEKSFRKLKTMNLDLYAEVSSDRTRCVTNSRPMS